MELLSYFRLAFLFISAIVFFRLTRRLVGKDLQGITLFGWGLALVLANIFVGALYHSNFLPKYLSEHVIRGIGYISGYLGLAAGLVLILFGTYRIIRSLQPHLDKYYVDLVDSLNGVVYEANATDFKFTFVSKRSLEMFGYTQGQWLKQVTWERLIHPEDLKYVFDFCVTAIREKRNHSLEYRALKADGTVVWVKDIVTIMQRSGIPTKLRGVLLDITERKKQEEEYRNKDASFRMMFSENPLPMWVYDLETLNFLEVNGTAIQNYGYTRDEFLSMKITDIRPQEQVPRLLKNLRKTRDAVERTSGWQHLLKNGKIIDVDITSHTIGFDGKNAVLVVAQDITESKRTEEQLILTREVLESIFHNLDQVFWSVNTQISKTIHVSSSCEKLYGVPSSAFLANAALWKEFIHPEDRELVERDEQEVMRGKTSNVQFRIINARGELRWVEVNVRPVKDHTGRVVRLDGITSDITEKHQAKQALEESEERYRRFFEQNLAGTYISTAEGQILACNPEFAKIFAFSTVEEVLKTDADSFYLNPAERQSFLNCLRKEKKLKYNNKTLKDKSGKPLNIIENVSGVFDKNGELVRCEGYIIDNSERKALEEQLRQAQKMESLGTLAGGIAHDFNNILGIILSYTTLLENSECDQATRATSTSAVTKAVQRGANLVRQILTLARRTKMTFEPVDINSCVEELSRMLRQTFPKTIEIELNLDETQPRISGDVTQIQQAILNLCVNARDAMPNEGIITISTKVVDGKELKSSFPKVEEDRYVQLRVADTGTGMDETTRSRIFEPFFTTKTNGKGTGLGLAVVYGIIQSHNGLINVESSVGRGTTFSLFLPVDESSVEDAETLKDLSSEPVNGSETVLVVEDEEPLLTVLEKTLSNHGFRVLIARDGGEAVEMFTRRKSEIALVLSDVGLPKVNGPEAVSRMRILNPSLRSILATGYLEPQMYSTVENAKVGAIIQKPYVPEEILRKVRQLLDEPQAETV